MPEAAAGLPASIRVIERGWVSSNNIVFLGAGATALVDTGYGRDAKQTVALVGHVLDGRRLDRIINTHTHSDHVGGNAALARAYPGVRVTIPAGEAQVVRDWDEHALLLAPMGQECERFDFDDSFDAGDDITLGDLRWRAIASPGHDMESLMLWCESERILISADALWENGFGVIFPALPPQTMPRPCFDAQRATLDAIAALDARLVIPGHGAPFRAVGAALERARSRLAWFEQDPERNTKNAMKVTLAFLLMIEGRLPLADLGARLAGLSLMGSINAALFRLPPDEFATLLVAELCRSGAARVVDGWVFPAAK
jgi:glyoxylase-like metal-dependent hydrolase (beta-lactamase superfamily II)